MGRKENINFQFNAGYFRNGDSVLAPEGSLIYPSTNILYDKRGVPVSAKTSTIVGNDSGEGGSRASVLDDALIAFMGNNTTTERAIGNIYQGANSDLWFVGNAISNAVRVTSNFSSFYPIGGTRQVETVTVTAGASAGGNLTVRITGAYLSASPQDVTVAVLNADTTAQVASKIVDALRLDAEVVAVYYILLSGSSVVLKDRTIRADDGTLAITLQAAGGTGVTFGASTNTTAGALDYAANLSSTPQVARYTANGWSNPVQVGLAPQEDPPTLELTEAATKGALYAGILTGSYSARLARKRNEAVSIASGLSNIVTANGNSVYVTIPAYGEDGSDLSERVWLLYFTYSGRGSQFSHFLFPIELPEVYLDGSEENGYTETVGSNCRLTVISQHATTQASRIVEIEFANNDLLLIQPFEDYYPLEACKFLAQIGNVTCGIGTGDNQTGFDVSYPNNRQAFPPTWRDWFREIPVSISIQADADYFWVACTNCTYQCVWTGSTQQTAPVVLRQVSNQYGAIGQGATISINGVLYMLSKGKIPIRINPDGQIDDKFGDRVIDEFNNGSFNSDTQIGYDEVTNTVYFTADGTATDPYMIGYQIDKDMWTSPILLVEGLDIDATFSLSGSMHYCMYVAGSGTYKSYKFNSDTGTDFPDGWQAFSTFKTGAAGFNLKDIIEVRALLEGEVSDTIGVAGTKDFDPASVDTLVSETITSTTKITFRKLVESIDYETIGCRVSGTKYGTRIHNVNFTIDNHVIERGKN